MATTYQNILTGLRAADIVADAKVNAGFTDGLTPPYISVIEYEHTLQYDTGGKALKDATFKVVVVAKTCDEAETLAEAVDQAVNLDTGLTPTTIGVFQESYRSSQMDEKLYQWAVEIGYKLTEDMGN